MNWNWLKMLSLLGVGAGIYYFIGALDRFQYCYLCKKDMFLKEKDPYGEAHLCKECMVKGNKVSILEKKDVNIEEGSQGEKIKVEFEDKELAINVLKSMAARRGYNVIYDFSCSKEDIKHIQIYTLWTVSGIPAKKI